MDWKKQPYWMNNFSCILHMRRKIKKTNCNAKPIGIEHITTYNGLQPSWAGEGGSEKDCHQQKIDPLSDARKKQSKKTWNVKIPIKMSEKPTFHLRISSFPNEFSSESFEINSERKWCRASSRQGEKVPFPSFGRPSFLREETVDLKTQKLKWSIRVGPRKVLD